MYYFQVLIFWNDYFCNIHVFKTIMTNVWNSVWNIYFPESNIAKTFVCNTWKIFLESYIDEI